MSKRTTAYFLDKTHSPCEIIGSIVKQWPGFITPTALFSGKKERKEKKSIHTQMILQVGRFKCFKPAHLKCIRFLGQPTRTNNT
jgi:hypothetical protein